MVGVVANPMLSRCCESSRLAFTLASSEEPHANIDVLAAKTAMNRYFVISLLPGLAFGTDVPFAARATSGAPEPTRRSRSLISESTSRRRQACCSLRSATLSAHHLSTKRDQAFRSELSAHFAPHEPRACQACTL